MKQLHLFDHDVSIVKHHWCVYIDGAARNNPGPAGAGVYITKDGEPIIKQGFFLGVKTNNQAEYLALLLALYLLKPLVRRGDAVEIISDSELLVRQLTGIYKVKDHNLKMLHDCIQQLFTVYVPQIKHVLRAANTVADSLANDGIDKKVLPPKDFLTLCPLPLHF